jgi:hypothetical protein
VSTDHAAEIEAAETRLAAAQAAVERLRAALAAELADREAYGPGTEPTGAEAGRLEALRRYPAKATGSSDAIGSTDAADQDATAAEAPASTTWADGVAAARARYPRR